MDPRQAVGVFQHVRTWLHTQYPGHQAPCPGVFHMLLLLLHPPPPPPLLPSLAPVERGSEVAGPGPQVCQAGGGGQVEQVVQEGDHLGRQVEVSCRLVVLEG